MPVERSCGPAEVDAEADPIRDEAEGVLNHALGPSNVIIVTELSEDVLTNPADLELLKSAFSDADVVEEMRPFPGIGRLRVVFRTVEGAVLARRLMNGSEWDSREVRIYFLKGQHIERPADAPDHEPQHGMYLEPPKLDNVHLLSPPPSPPVGWEHNVEPIPTVDQALISALAGLTANEETTLHPARGNMPAIVIMPCEDVDVDPEHRRRAIAHREELAKRLGKGLAPVTLPKKGDKPPRTPRPPMPPPATKAC